MFVCLEFASPSALLTCSMSFEKVFCGNASCLCMSSVVLAMGHT